MCRMKQSEYWYFPLCPIVEIERRRCFARHRTCCLTGDKRQCPFYRRRHNHPNEVPYLCPQCFPMQVRTAYKKYFPNSSADTKHRVLSKFIRVHPCPSVVSISLVLFYPGYFSRFLCEAAIFALRFSDFDILSLL